jgi:hypothetical protein
MSDDVVLCAFWRESRFDFCVRLCDNLRNGMPLCVVSGLNEFVADWDEDFENASMEMGLAELEYYFPEKFVPDERCGRVVRSDIYESFHPEFKKSGCFFGGLCVRPKFHGFDGCSVDCPRWAK